MMPRLSCAAQPVTRWLAWHCVLRLVGATAAALAAPLPAPGLAAPIVADDAVRDAHAAGAAANAAARAAITAPRAADAVPGYTRTPPEAALAGQANLTARAGAHLGACKNTPGDAACDAQRGALASATLPRTPLPDTAATASAARALARHPERELGSLAAYYPGCVTRDTAMPATTETRICERTRTPVPQSCARTLTVAIMRASTCAPGTWGAPSDAGGVGADVQCLPDRPATAQHVRITVDGTPVIYFDADVARARALPERIATLPSVREAGAFAGAGVWLADTACDAARCTATVLVAPDDAKACTATAAGADASTPAPACTGAPPFVAAYAACPAGQRGGDALAPECDGCRAAGDAGWCYAPAPGAPAVGLATPALGWIPVAPRTVTGWRVDTARTGPVARLRLAIARATTTWQEQERWDDGCAAPPAGCTVGAPARCTDGPATKTIDGHAVTRACWQTTRPLACAADTASDTCAPLAANGCALRATRCVETDPATGACVREQGQYDCAVPATTTTTVAACPQDVFCLGTTCFDTRHPPDADFARTVTLLEAGREAGVYLDGDTLTVFRGEPAACRDRLLANCCATDRAGAGMTNASLFPAGSRFVYDVLMNAGNRAFVTEGVRALLAGRAASGSFTTYGVTVALDGAALPAGAVPLVATDSLVLAFDPWSLAVTAIFSMATSLASCSADEGKLALQRGARLCHTIGTTCTSCLRVLGQCVACVEQTTASCCFNSRIARVLNEAGRRQLGRDWGSADAPDCRGLTVAQLQSLDLAAIDFSEVYEAIVPDLPDPGAWRASAAARLEALVAHAAPPAPPMRASAAAGPTMALPPVPPGVPPPAPSTPGPFGHDPADYIATFTDDFDQGFDRTRWNDQLWYGSPDPTPSYAVEDGMLLLWPTRDAQGQWRNRTIDTDGKFTQTYGYFEIEAKLPIGKGVWPAFWLFNHLGARRPEIDILEAYPGGGPASGWGDAQLHPVAYSATIWQDAGVQAGYRRIATPDLAAGFHRYGLKWEPDRITFYFDGASVYSAAVAMRDPMYLMLDLWYGSASGAPDASTPTGRANAFAVNYVRAWRLR